jgi:hypothetical protein
MLTAVQIKQGIEKELARADWRHKNCNGNMVHMTTPKEMFYIIKAYGMMIEQQSMKISELSYPDASHQSHVNFTKILLQLANIIKSNQYESVLWMPEIWQAATAGCDAFIGKRYEVALAPQIGTFWWQAMGLRHLENPFSVDPTAIKWWTPEWELHGIYQYPSDRIISHELQNKYGGRAGVVDATGSMSFWVKTVEDPNDYKTYSDDEMTFRVAHHPGLPYGDLIDEGYCQYIAAESFLRLPFVSTVKEPVLNHNERKAYKHFVSKPPEVTTILLRKPEQKKRMEGEEVRHIDYKCQFIVSPNGAWRRAKPNSKTGNPEFVRPYLKGNPDGPFKAPSAVVKVATR